MSITSIAYTIDRLKKGGVVAFPTETVYALAGDACNPDAISRIFKIKDRGFDRPLSVLIHDLDCLSYWVDEIPHHAKQFAQQFWPGPLTLIFTRKKSARCYIAPRDQSIGLRIPNHPIAKKILQDFPRGLAASSANRTGQASAIRAKQVHKHLGVFIDSVVDSNRGVMGIESTIVDVRVDPPQIIREGAIKSSLIRQNVF
jgi:L-threonylcarbamoyladenylate synthase